MCICIEKVVPDLQLQQHISTTLATHWQRISNTVVPDLLLQQLLDQLLARVIFKHFFRPLVRERLVCHRLRACVRVCVCVCVCVRAYSTIYAISPLENMGAGGGGGGGGGVLKLKHLLNHIRNILPREQRGRRGFCGIALPVNPSHSLQCLCRLRRQLTCK